LTDGPVTRGEFDMLRQNLSEVAQRLNNVDTGKDGVAAMAVQVRELATDLGELKADVNTRFEQHLTQHTEDLKARAAARRWMIGTVIGAAGAMGTVITMLLDVLRHLH
jgi:hypothetical protein